MNKAQFLAAVESKVGFHSIIKDEVAPDHIAGDSIEKRYLYINHINADGTAGKTHIEYLYDTVNDVAWFYNQEREAVDVREPSADQKKLNALEAYLKANFNAYFLIRANLTNNWAEADTYKLEIDKLVHKKVMVYKISNNPIAHLEII